VIINDRLKCWNVIPNKEKAEVMLTTEFSTPSVLSLKDKIKQLVTEEKIRHFFSLEAVIFLLKRQSTLESSFRSCRKTRSFYLLPVENSESTILSYGISKVFQGSLILDNAIIRLLQ
jgi:hypothetical protein